jgi:hypothetical protein
MQQLPLCSCGSHVETDYLDGLWVIECFVCSNTVSHESERVCISYWVELLMKEHNEDFHTMKEWENNYDKWFNGTYIFHSKQDKNDYRNS